MATPNGSEPVRNKISEVTDTGTKEYLIAAKRGPQARASGQIQPLSAMQFQSTLGSIAAIKVKRTVPRHGAAAPMSMFAGEATDVVVADIDTDSAQMLRKSANSAGLIVEPNEPLEYVGMSPFRAPSFAPPVAMSGAMEPRKVQIRVMGTGDAPLAEANVMLQGDGFMQTGKTNIKGDVTVDLWAVPGGRARYLWVKPKADHWDRYIATPDLVDNSVNVVRLQSFAETIPGFPANFGYGWGQKMMGLPNRPDFAKGSGIKIAIIDSGADIAHPLLNHIKFGLDASTEALKDGWKNDTIGHGSHVAGVITANGGDGSLYTGFAPEAEIHVIKVFPGGYDSLIQALNYCVAQKVDVVNMSLGGAEVSLAVEQALQEAAMAGIACIVAAGNSGDNVKYPASSPNSLAVSAIGSMMETRPQSWAQTQILADSIASDGVYAARFSCHGPEIGVCAPGVAIVSTLPGGSYGVDDGTSMASPHVTGMAALLLAHHPAFKSTFAQRNQARVAALFGLLRTFCTAYAFPEARAGAGLPILANTALGALVPGTAIAQPGQTNNQVPVTNVPQPVPGGEMLHTLSVGPGNLIGGALGGNAGNAGDIWPRPVQWINPPWPGQMQPQSGFVWLPQNQAMQTQAAYLDQYFQAAPGMIVRH